MEQSTFEPRDNETLFQCQDIDIVLHMRSRHFSVLPPRETIDLVVAEVLFFCSQRSCFVLILVVSVLHNLTKVQQIFRNEWLGPAGPPTNVSLKKQAWRFDGSCRSASAFSITYFPVFFRSLVIPTSL